MPYGKVVTLQVAINSSNNALLTLLVSNNFVELKSESEPPKLTCFQIRTSDVAVHSHTYT